MHTNELTYNELSAQDIIPNDWGHIDVNEYSSPDYDVYSDDPEVCFKMSVWLLQCNYSKLVLNYVNAIRFGIECSDLFEKLIAFKAGLEVLNKYNPRDIVNETTDYNIIKYSTIRKILNKLNTY